MIAKKVVFSILHFGTLVTWGTQNETDYAMRVNEFGDLNHQFTANWINNNRKNKC